MQSIELGAFITGERLETYLKFLVKDNEVIDQVIRVTPFEHEREIGICASYIIIYHQSERPLLDPTAPRKKLRIENVE